MQSPSPIAGRPIVILGMDRSGTSMAANMVHAWGAYGGDLEYLAKGHEMNAHGFWENAEQQRLIAELLWRSGVVFWEPTYGEAVKRRAQDPRLREWAEGFVASMASKSPFWFCKEPWLSIQLPFWKEFLRDAVYVITVRNPYDSARSLEAATIPPEVKGVKLVALMLLRWQILLLSILRDTADTSSKLFVEYERLTSAPADEAERLCEFLCRECGVPAEDRASRMTAVIDPALRRHRGLPFDEQSIATPEQKALYAFLQSKVDDPDLPFDESKYPLYAGYCEYYGNMAWTRNYFDDTSRAMRAYPVRAGLAINNRMQAVRRGLSRVIQPLTVHLPWPTSRPRPSFPGSRVPQ